MKFQLFTLLNLYISLFSKKNEKLVFVFQIFRHGVRTPIYREEMKGTRDNFTDFFNFRWYANGELTEKGNITSYELGKRCNKRYKELTENIDINNEFRVLSTNLSRAKQSGLSFLQGYFSSNNTKELEKLMDDLPSEEVKQIRVREICKNAKDMIYQSRKSKIVENALKNVSQSVGDKLALVFGEKNSDFLKSYKISKNIFGNYVSDYTYNKSNLLHLNDKYNISIDELYEYGKYVRFYVLYYGIITPILANVAVLKTIPKILEMMNDVIKGNKVYKFYSYSSHDTFMTPFMLFMNQTFNTGLYHPDYSSYISFELYKIENEDNYIVKFVFDDNILLEINYINFVEKIKTNLWSNKKINDLCGNVIDKSTSMNIQVLTFFILIIIVLSTNLLVQIKAKKHKTSNHKDETIVYKELIDI